MFSKLSVVLAIVCTTFAAVPAVAGAASSPKTSPPISVSSLSSVAVSGTTNSGKQFTGRLVIERFISRGGRTFAVGTLTGFVGHRRVHATTVTVPASIGSGSQGSTPAAVCPVLHLVLGPLSLNLLGLHVHLNQVVLDITAVSGPGQLLGNLLCSVAHLLDQQSLGAGQTAALLNIVEQLLNVPALLKL